MERPMPTDQLNEKGRESNHGQTSVPDLRTVAPAPFPFLLGIELGFRGQFRRSIQAHFRPLKACGDQIGKPLDERLVGIESTNTSEVHHTGFSGQFPVLDIDFLERFDVLADEADGDNH